MSTSIWKTREAIKLKVADAIVIGGGPAGSTCAWKLRAAGVDVLVLDRAIFPRLKLCAGWVTPEALLDLEIDPEASPLNMVAFDKLVLHWNGHTVNLPTRQYSIRRYEFDDFLLRRSAARIEQHNVREIYRDGSDYIVDGRYRARYIVGAGGTACPVYRSFFRTLNARSSQSQIAAYEQEFPYDWRDPSCHLWFFDDGLPGYAWYVPKANGYINIGLGGAADKIKLRGGHVRDYWRSLVTKLERQDLVCYDGYDPRGYSYYLRDNVDVVQLDNAYIAGDSVGLATRDMGEGIGPAISSGLLAAQSIVTGSDYSLDKIHKYSATGFAKNIFERRKVAA